MVLCKPSAALDCCRVFRGTVVLGSLEETMEGDGQGSQGTERHWICIPWLDATLWKEIVDIFLMSLFCCKQELQLPWICVVILNGRGSGREGTCHGAGCAFRQRSFQTVVAS